jgi:uncharacterized damage-inducible protein DinB
MEEVKRYPIGKFEKPETFDRGFVQPLIDELDLFPDLLEAVIHKLRPDQLKTKTLPGVWSVAQVVNHIADSHMNAFIRIKLTLTEENPTVKPYREDLWANLVDGEDANLEHSLGIIRGVHKRMVLILRDLNDAALMRTYFHPGYNITYAIGQVVALYAWHGKHHRAFISELIRERQW